MNAKRILFDFVYIGHRGVSFSFIFFFRAGEMELNSNQTISVETLLLFFLLRSNCVDYSMPEKEVLLFLFVGIWFWN